MHAMTSIKIISTLIFFIKSTSLIIIFDSLTTIVTPFIKITLQYTILIGRTILMSPPQIVRELMLYGYF